jgi:hypothetical protein
VSVAQNSKLIEQCGLNAIKVKDQTIRADNAKSTVMAKLTYDKDFGDRLTSKKKENEVLHKQILEYKTDRQIE